MFFTYLMFVQTVFVCSTVVVCTIAPSNSPVFYVQVGSMLFRLNEWVVTHLKVVRQHIFSSKYSQGQTLSLCQNVVLHYCSSFHPAH